MSEPLTPSLAPHLTCNVASTQTAVVELQRPVFANVLDFLAEDRESTGNAAGSETPTAVVVTGDSLSLSTLTLTLPSNEQTLTAAPAP
jgi:hypothetical protein